MITFSRKYKNDRELLYGRYRFHHDRAGREYSSGIEEREKLKYSFLLDHVRRRIERELVYIIRNGYLESFLTVENEGKYHLREDTLQEVYLTELGEHVTDIIDCKKLSFISSPIDDFRFFDFIEVVIIFCREEKRTDLIKRLNLIFNETATNFIISEGIIYKKSQSGIRSIIPLIKDLKLKTKLEEYMSLKIQDTVSYIAEARLAADIRQMLFSSDEDQSKSKKVAETVIGDIVAGIDSSDKKQELKKTLNELVLLASTLNNRIEDIRHTDRHTIPVDQPSLYKLISNLNFNIIELAILSNPSKYINTSDVESLKKEYLEKYGVNKDDVWKFSDEDRIFDFDSDDELPF